MSRTVRTLALMALSALSTSAMAQAPAAAPESTPTAGDAATKPVEVPPAEAGLTDRALRLNAMESDLALALKGLQLDSANAQRNELSGKVNGIRQGTNALPELVGISGVAGVYRAQFLAGSAVVDVGIGDWVSADWRVSRLSSTGVELTKRGSGVKHQVLFGQRPVSSREIAADIAAAANASAALGLGGGTTSVSTVSIPNNP